MRKNNNYNDATNNDLIRQAYINWLTDIPHLRGFKWSYFFTLTFRYDLKDYNEVNWILKKFYKQLNKEVFSKRSNKALRIVTFIENSFYHGYHIHVICEDPSERLITSRQKVNAGSEEDFKDTIETVWNNVDKRTGKPDFDGFSSSFQEVRNDEGLFHYTTKELINENHEAINYTVFNVDGYRLPQI